MKIIIEGSPKELAKLAAVLNGAVTAEKKSEIPPLLTELADDEKRNKMANDIQRALAKTTETGRGKENAPQAETAETKLPVMPFFV